MLVSTQITVTGAPECGPATTTSYGPAQTWNATDSRLCRYGDPVSPIYNPTTHTWSWSCAQSGYANVSCQSQPGSVCGSANGVPTATSPTANLCGTGNPSTVNLANNTYSWSCSGPNSDVVACSAPQEVNGVCGSAHNTPTYSAPSSNLCLAGSPTTVQESGNTFTWSCNSTT